MSAHPAAPSSRPKPTSWSQSNVKTHINVNSAAKIVGQLLGEEVVPASDVAAAAAVDGTDVANIDLDAAAEEDPGHEERTEIAIARELITLDGNLRGNEGPEMAEEAADKVQALAHELLVMHGAEENDEDEEEVDGDLAALAGLSDGVPGGESGEAAPRG